MASLAGIAGEAGVSPEKGAVHLESGEGSGGALVVKSQEGPEGQVSAGANGPWAWLLGREIHMSGVERVQGQQSPLERTRLTS